jgi:hypothetical protein
VGVLLIASAAAVRATRAVRAEGSSPGAVARLLQSASRGGLSPVTANGVRMAVEPGRGRRAVPVRSAMFGAVFGVVGVIAVLMFASSLDHLVATPAQYGWRWAFVAGPQVRSVTGSHSPLLRVPGLAALEEIDTVSVQLDSHPVTAWGYRSMRGTIDPEIVAGRAAHGPNEIALGAATLDELGKSIGDTVQAQGPNGAHNYRIVGRAAFPVLDSPQPLANGAAFTGVGLARILSENNNNNGTPYIVMRLAPGASVAATERRVDAIPNLAALALIAVGHALVTSVRRRRHELAILKTLGFKRRQVRTTVAWQATTLAAIGLIVGIPVGLVVGAFIWRQVASGLGIAPTADVPTLALFVVIPCAVVAVNLLAFFPARAAARTRPAVALRAE